MGKIRVGTCSWTDPTLLHSGWYPREAGTAGARLQFYAQRFDIVEVDSTYYSLLPERTAGLWCERTPSDFVFDVKAFSLFTQHPTQVRALPAEVRSGLGASAEKGTIYLRDLPGEVVGMLWRRFVQALLPLDSAGKLGVVLFQFPQWFFPSHQSRDYLARCQERLGQYRIAVEFRNGAWLDEGSREGTLRFLRDNHMVYVSVDEPQGFRSSVPPLAEATSEVAVVRFHGRNRETWEKKGISVAERFKYLYSQDELSEWLPRIQHLAAQAGEVHVLFNNCYGDYGVRNAEDMKELLAEAGNSPA